MEATKSSDTAATSTPWALLGLAVTFEIAGAIGLRFSEGFTLILPTTSALAAFALALYLVSHVMKELPVSIAYPIWAGGGTAGVALIGIFALGEAFTVLKAVGIALILTGVIFVNIVSEKRSGC